MNKVYWDKQFKITLAMSDPSMNHHDVVKLLLVRKLIWEHRREKAHIRIYTEFEATEGVICDVYMENTKTKEAFAFEIQKDFSPKWLKKKTEQYKDWEVPYFKSSDFIPINLNKMSKDYSQIYMELDDYVV